MNDSMNDEEFDVSEAKVVGKYEKAHNRSIVGIWTFRFSDQIGVISVGHDSVKLWLLSENNKEGTVQLDDTMVIISYRSAVQSADVSQDGKYAIIVLMNSVVHEILMETTVENGTRDFGYLEAVFCSVSPLKTGYVTAAYSGTLNEVPVCATVPSRKEPLQNVKGVSCLKYSRDAKYVAIGQLDGGMEIVSTENFKSHHKYEVHSMRIRKIEFLPGDEQFLSASDDRLIKLHSLVDFGGEVDPTRSTKALRVYSAHNSPVTGLTIDEKSGGTRFASSSISSQIFIWHIELTTPIITVVNDHSSAISALSFSPTGRHLISGGDDAMIHVFAVPPIGEMTPDNTAYYEIEETTKEKQHDSDYNEGQDLSPQHADEQPSSEYQEYRPYAEPRTPPQDDGDEELDDFVYTSNQENVSDDPELHTA